MRKKMIWTTLLTLLVSLVMVNVATSSGTNMIYVDPPVIWEPTMPIGTEFSVDISVDYVERLCIWQVHLFFDPAVIEGVSIELPEDNFLESKNAVATWYPGEGFDNEIGVLYLVVAALDPQLPLYKYPTGGGVLFTVTFRKVAHGSSSITLGPDCGLLDRLGRFISKGNVEHGFFSNAAPELYIRRGGSGGGAGAWVEYASLDLCEDQTLYSSVANKGTMGSWVKVKFTVDTPAGIIVLWTEPMHVIPTPDERVTVSCTFHPEVPGYYWIYAELWFKAGEEWMPDLMDWEPYSDYEATFGGFGDTKSEGTPVKFKVS